ncbi:competence type IV pilus major pilin ComGC [Rossellomorea aquimaris]|uniref:competence type IV pilus major pilin ComGC n=1 Tax=Bacillaceae TaxID=186817 RepID=UPI0011E96DC2|nr:MULTISPECIES: competence type IV pilus major pilin ComGC [Bacillaceae]
MINNEKGFTLIEMMIVLLVISVLLFITIPNVTKQGTSINSKGCEAFENMVSGQVEAYRMEEKALPADLEALIDKGYLKDDYQQCPDGRSITINSEGEVIVGS